MENGPTREQLRAEMRRRIHERVWGKEALHRVSFWGKKSASYGMVETGQVMPQLIGVVDFSLDASGTWLLTNHVGTDQTVMTRIPANVEHITVDREEPAA